METEDYDDVVLIGAGTTGLALARLLDIEGVRVTLVDPNPIVTNFPRGSHIDDEIMRLFQTLGLADAEPGYMVMDGVVALDPNGDEVFKFDMTEEQTDQGWLPDYQFFQPDFESILRGRLFQSERVTLRLGWRVTRVINKDEGVSVELTHRSTGETQIVEASYVVGCDGARSTTRALVSDATEDLGGTRGAFIVDIYRFVDMPSLPARRSTILASPRPVNYQPGIPPYSRFNFVLTGKEDAAALENPETVYEYLSPWIAPGDYRILRSDVYEYDARLVRGWRRGRVLIAGDAAHLMPPYLGQGMCSGLRDAANLAWKLARIVQGRSDDSLLDTYETERVPNVRGMIEESKRLGNQMAAICDGVEEREDTEVVDRSRAGIGPGIGIAGGCHSGALSAQPEIDGVRLDDIVGYAFALVASAVVLESIPVATRNQWVDWGVRIVPAKDGCESWLAALGADAAIIRPDRYIFSATTGQQELLDAFAQLIDQLSPAKSPAPALPVG